MGRHRNPLEQARTIHGRLVRITQHALQQARARFKGLAGKSKVDIRKIIRGVVYKGEYFGSSYVVDDFYRLGKLDWSQEEIAVVCKDAGPEGITVVTVMTPEEIENAGPYRGEK